MKVPERLRHVQIRVTMFHFINWGTKPIHSTHCGPGFLLINFDTIFYVRYRSEEISPAVLLRALAQSAATGHIGTIKFFVDQSQVTDNWSEEKKTEQKAVWEITEKVEVQDSHPAGTVVQIEGGRGKESKITFEEAFQTVLYKIC